MLWRGERLTKSDLAFALFIAAAILTSVLIPGHWILGDAGNTPKSATQNVVRTKGTVISVDNSDVKQYGMVKTGEQTVEAKVEKGDFSGRRIKATNILMGKLELDKMFSEGDKVLLALSLHPEDGHIVDATAVDHYRIDKEKILVAVFVVLLVIFAGWTGAKAVLSFVFAGVLIWKVLLPAFLAGWDPVLIAFGVVSLLTFVIIFLIGGLNLRGLVAFIGSMTGVGLTAVFAITFGQLMKIHGAVKPFAETLLYSGYGHLNLTSIFLAGIFLASSGAVMDIGMDIAASMAEVKAKRPSIGILEHIRSGLTVGRAIIGTMTTTLLLAYSGGYTTLLMVFMAQGTPGVNILNLTYVAAEILHTMVGSFGLVLVAPATAIVGGFIYARWQPQLSEAT